MLKKIALLALLIIPMSIFAQTLKFGHVRSYEVIQIMPEYEKAMADLQDLQKKYTDEIKRANDEFNRKYQEFIQQQDSLPRNIAERRQKELQDLMERGQQFEQEVQENMQKAQGLMQIYYIYVYKLQEKYHTLSVLTIKTGSGRFLIV